MTLQDLHSMPDFVNLFTDKRFVAAIQFLREHPDPKNNTGGDATLIIRSEGSWHGWFGCLEKLEQLSRPPQQPTPTISGQKYVAPQPIKSA